MTTTCRVTGARASRPWGRATRVVRATHASCGGASPQDRDGPRNSSRTRAGFVVVAAPSQVGREALAEGVLGDHPRVEELQQVVGPARLGADARQAVAAERLAPDDRAGDAPG